MNLFISWSGERSHLVAKALHPWIKCVVQSIEPFFSPRDISGGSIWINKLSDKLASSHAGVICLTPENQHEPWIQFEAGALAKGLTENRVFILLIGLESHEVTGPLASFNHTLCSKEDIKKMVFNLNELLPEKRLDSEILERVFEKNFLDFDDEIKKALEIQSNPKTKKRESSDIQLEMLDLLRGLSSRVSKMESKANKLNQSEGQISGDTSRINSLLNAKPTAVAALFNALNSNEERMRDNQEKHAIANELFRRLRESDSTSSETGGGI